MALPIEAAINASLTPIDGHQAAADGLPHVTHAGEFEIVPGLLIRCFRLSDGRTVIAEESMRDFWRCMSIPGPAKAAGA